MVGYDRAVRSHLELLRSANLTFAAKALDWNIFLAVCHGLEWEKLVTMKVEHRLNVGLRMCSLSRPNKADYVSMTDVLSDHLARKCETISKLYLDCE